MSKINRRLMPTQKEKNLFFTAATVGLVGGLLGNLFISAGFDLLNSYEITRESRWFVFIVSGIVFFGIAIWFMKKIKPIYKNE